MFLEEASFKGGFVKKVASCLEEGFFVEVFVDKASSSRKVASKKALLRQVASRQAASRKVDRGGLP